MLRFITMVYGDYVELFFIDELGEQASIEVWHGSLQGDVISALVFTGGPSPTPPCRSPPHHRRYLEIYAEEIRDLLSKISKQRLALKEKPDTGVYAKELSSFVTKSVKEIEVQSHLLLL